MLSILTFVAIYYSNDGKLTMSAALYSYNKNSPLRIVNYNYPLNVRLLNLLT